MARSDQTAFRVRILEGPFSGENVDLVGRQLPYRSGEGGNISFGRVQRTKLTWYPGNPQASQQIIGPTLDPTSINGIWKERFLGEDEPIRLVELFERLCSTGVQVRVSWQTIERIGIVKAVQWAPGAPTGGLTDIEWTIEFEWNSEGAPFRTVNENAPTLQDFLVNGAEALNLLSESLEAFSAGVSSFAGLVNTAFAPTAATIRDEQERIATQFSILSQSAVDIAQNAQIPSGVVQNSVSAAEGGQAAASRLADALISYTPAATTANDALAAILNQAIDRYDVIDAATAALRSSFEVRVRFEPLIRPERFATITAAIGTDLRRVANDFYGDADLWTRIARFNGLETSLIPRDVEEILVPLSLPDALDPREDC